MSALYKASQLILWLLIIIGLWGALSVSYTNIMGTTLCPNFLNIPLCYLVSIGYLLMLGAQFIFFSQSKKLKDRIFYSGLSLVFLIAALGVGFEIAIGDICPKSANGTPLCLLSFTFCVFLFILYTFTSNKH